MAKDQLENWRKEFLERKDRAKRAMYCLLDQHPTITAIDADFDGYADSGQVEQIRYYSDSGDAVSAPEELDGAVEEYIYAILPDGWEINEGSFGIVQVDVRARSAKCEFAWRTTEDASFAEE